MDDNNFIKKYVEELKNLNLSDDEILTFTTFLQIFVNDYISKKLNNFLSDEEIEALDFVALEEGINNYQKMLLYMEAYHDKSGKTIEEEIEKLLSELLEVLKTSQEKSKEILEKIQKLEDPEDPKALEEIYNSVLGN